MSLIETLITAAIATFLLYFVSLSVVLVSQEKTCLDAGYPRAYVTWDYQTYCSKIEGTSNSRVVRSGNL